MKTKYGIGCGLEALPDAIALNRFVELERQAMEWPFRYGDAYRVDVHKNHKIYHVIRSGKRVKYKVLNVVATYLSDPDAWFLKGSPADTKFSWRFSMGHVLDDAWTRSIRGHVARTGRFKASRPNRSGPV